MTINLSETTIYIGIIVVLVIIQIYQQTTIKRLEKECKDLWDQLGTLTYSITNKMLEIHKDLNGKQDKK
jgi:hypothetical protein